MTKGRLPDDSTTATSPVDLISELTEQVAATFVAPEVLSVVADENDFFVRMIQRTVLDDLPHQRVGNSGTALLEGACAPNGASAESSHIDSWLDDLRSYAFETILQEASVLDDAVVG